VRLFIRNNKGALSFISCCSGMAIPSSQDLTGSCALFIWVKRGCLKIESEIKMSTKEKIEADELLEVGIKYFKENDFHTSIMYLKKAIDLDPFNDRTLLYTGSAYVALFEADLALKYCKKALEINQYSGMIFYTLGVAYQLKDEHDNALQSFIKSLELNPSYVDSLWSVAESYKSCKNPDYRLSMSFYEKTLKIDPGHHGSHFGLFDLYYKTGDIANAKKWIIKGARLGSSECRFICEELNINW